MVYFPEQFAGKIHSEPRVEVRDASAIVAEEAIYPGRSLRPEHFLDMKINLGKVIAYLHIQPNNFSSFLLLNG